MNIPRGLQLIWPDPADDWFSAVPIGNGRQGAVIFGGADARLQINDACAWSGHPSTPEQGLRTLMDRGAGPDRLAELRRAITAGDHSRSRELGLGMEGDYTQEFLPFVELTMVLRPSGRSEAHTIAAPRTLDLQTGVLDEIIDFGDHTIRRRTYASHPAEAICVEISSERPFDLHIGLTSQLRIADQDQDDSGLFLGVDLPVDGAPQHEPEVPGHRYTDQPLEGYDPYGVAVVRCDTDGQVANADGWQATRASRVLMVITASVSGEDAWNDHDQLNRASHRRRAADRASAALGLGADRLLAEHLADFTALTRAAGITIGAAPDHPLDVGRELLGRRDPAEIATAIHAYGRYLLASSSRADAGPPANLQGIWNPDLRPAWSSNYTVNINLQMNYWGADAAGLGPALAPYVSLLRQLSRTGADVAGRLYGCRGWVTHHNTDVWGWALPVGMGHGDPSWALWQLGGVWLTHQLWDSYLYNQDQRYLRNVWPIIRGATEFCLDWLVEQPDGTLGTNPSTSPENLFRTPDGGTAALSTSTAMDIALIRGLFESARSAARILGLQEPLVTAIDESLPKLPAPGVTIDGRLREWADDPPEADPQHRHLSPLIGLFPLDQITPEETPDLAEAARRTLDGRGPGAMGWSWSWKIALRARLGDGNACAELLEQATRPLARNVDLYAPPDGSVWGGLLPNLFSTHPPFQIDGNFGLMAAIGEMIMQSHRDRIRLLPALPDSWPSGSAYGLRGRGGLVVNLAWNDGQLLTVTLRRLAGDPDRPVTIRYGDHTTLITVGNNTGVTLDEHLDLVGAAA